GIMHLVEKKKLSLDEQVFGPKGILKEKSYCEVIDPRIFQITVEDLLRHQGGFCRGCEGDPMFRGPDIARIMQTELPTDWETTVKYVLTQQRLLFEPGTVFNYSNFGYKVLEKVIEAKTKMTYEGYLQKYFLLPLDIHYMRLGKNLYKDKFRHETRYYDQDEAPLAASLYPEQDSLPRMYGGNDIELLGGAGGWIASPVDLLKLLTIADGHSAVKDYFSAETLQKMITPSDPTHRHTVIGWKSVDSTAKTWIRTGTYAGTNALLVRGPEEFSYCVLTNKSLWSAGKFNYETKRLMKQVIQKLKTVKLQTKSASDGLL
ncbi:MAG: serine hydrolase domain-containing protein, partial [Thermonemataceae bacterium]